MSDLIRRGDALSAILTLLRWPTMHSGLVSVDDVSAAIAALPAVTVGVRPLVWKGDSIRVTANGMGKYYSCTRMFHGQKGAGWECDEGDWHPSLDAAKAVAQFDFKARILAALEPVAAPRRYMGQIMAECDCSRQGECEAAQKCLAAPDPAAIREAWEKAYWRMRSYAVHDNDCKLNKPPRFDGPCSCGLTAALEEALALIQKGAAEPTEYERKVAQMKKDFPNGI